MRFGFSSVRTRLYLFSTRLCADDGASHQSAEFWVCRQDQHAPFMFLCVVASTRPSLQCSDDLHPNL